MHVLSIGTLIVCVGASVRAEMIRFDQSAVGATPAGWTVAMTHSGGAPKWEITRDDSAPNSTLALAQVSRDQTAGRFPLAVWDRATFRDGEVSATFRAIAGEIDQAAGIVW